MMAIFPAPFEPWEVEVSTPVEAINKAPFRVGQVFRVVGIRVERLHENTSMWSVITELEMIDDPTDSGL